MEKIKSIINPETDLEKRIVSDKEFIEGALWGKPRNGHPEGVVIYHIGEVLANVDKFSPSKEDREKLRLIAIIHDTFKNKVDQNRPKDGENHHALIARRFAEKYTDDHEVLEIIELHDEAYNSWVKGARKGKWEAAEKRAESLIKRLKGVLSLYLIFYKCDNQTGNKKNNDYEWFEKFAKRNAWMIHL